MTKRKILLLVGLFLLVVFAGIAVYFSQAPAFTGERIKNPDAYLLDIRKMNGTDSHTLSLLENDRLAVHFSDVKGSLRLEIRASAATALYSGAGKTAEDFTVNIPNDGIYTLSVQAKNASGSLSVQRIPTEQ